MKQPLPVISGLMLLLGSAIQLAASLPAQGRAGPGTQPLSVKEQQLVTALDRFTAAMHDEIMQPGENSAWSPASIGLALLMLEPGARGATAVELGEILQLPDSLRGKELYAASRMLLARTLPGEGSDHDRAPRIHIANDFWGQSEHVFVRDYVRLIEDSFDAHIHALDFATDPEAARQRINRHIAQATNRQIEEIIPAGLLSRQTRAVISNALYYRGRWLADFHRPKELYDFFVTPETVVKASFIKRTDTFYYRETERLQAVQIPLDDRAMAFEIVLPKPGQDLGVATAALVAGNAALWRDREAVRVAVALPAFEIETRTRLKRALQRLGLASAFDPGRADFSGIDASTPLVIDDLLHGAVVKVDEHGVEAAAATVSVLRAGAAVRPAEPKSFRADRPFAFGIRDRRTGLLLFCGQHVQPTGGA